MKIRQLGKCFSVWTMSYAIAISALAMLLSAVSVGDVAFADNPTAVEFCPRGQNIGGLWTGVFHSVNPTGALNGGTVQLTIMQDGNENHPGRRFSFNAMTGGMQVSGDGTVSATGHTQIKGQGSLIIVVRAFGDVNGCPQATAGDFRYDVLFTDGVRDEGTVNLTHCTVGITGNTCPSP